MVAQRENREGVKAVNSGRTSRGPCISLHSGFESKLYHLIELEPVIVLYLTLTFLCFDFFFSKMGIKMIISNYFPQKVVKKMK